MLPEVMSLLQHYAALQYHHWMCHNCRARLWNLFGFQSSGKIKLRTTLLDNFKSHTEDRSHVNPNYPSYKSIIQVFAMEMLRGAGSVTDS